MTAEPLKKKKTSWMKQYPDDMSGMMPKKADWTEGCMDECMEKCMDEGMENPMNVECQGMEAMPQCMLLAHAYVPWQTYCQAFSPREALMKGTLFPELWGVYPIPE